MTHLSRLMTRETLVASAFAFFLYGKYVLVMFVLAIALRTIDRNRISRRELESLVFYFLVVLIFVAAFFNGVVNGNSVDHILRNNFGSLLFLFVGLVLLWGVSGSESYQRIDTLIWGFYFWAIIFLLMYLVFLLFPEHRINYNEVVSGSFGFNVLFSSGVGEGHFAKIFSGILVIYLFLIPLAFSRRFQVPGAWMIFTLLIVLTASFTQYFIIVMYAFSLFVYKAVQGRITLKALYAAVVLIGFVVGFSAYTGLGEHVYDKAQSARELAAGEFDNENLNTVSKRIIQARVLASEIADAPFVGHGLGYESKEYNQIREGWGRELRYYNRSMYELQFMDVPMKFGVLGAGALLMLFVAYPLLSILAMRAGESALKGSFFLGFVGVIIYATNNGNYFYSYATMFCWGLAVMFSLCNRRSLLSLSGRD